MPHKAFPAPPRQNTSVWCKTRHKTVEFGDPETRRVAENSGNSKRTQTRIITECSNGDVQVLRTVKNGVSTLWMHQVKAVSFTLHQMLKYPHGKGVAIVFRNSSIHPPPEVTTPVLEIVHGDEDVFLSGFSLAEARVVQNILAIDEGLYVSAQSVYLTNKL